MPVHEAGTERLLPENCYMVSRTDRLGVITYANDLFAEISGYTLGELIGRKHNVVRHPDMPTQVFIDMWHTLEGGQHWRGVIKDRAKNGDYYWSDMRVSPVHDGWGSMAGFVAIRTRPEAAAIAAAEARYRAMQAASPAPVPARVPLRQRLASALRTVFRRGTLPALLACLSGAALLASLTLKGGTVRVSTLDDTTNPVRDAGRHAAQLIDTARRAGHDTWNALAERRTGSDARIATLIDDLERSALRRTDDTLDKLRHEILQRTGSLREFSADFERIGGGALPLALNDARLASRDSA